MVDFTPVASAIGGLVLGLAAGLLFLFNGKISGISGILAGASRSRDPWRWAFLAGLLTGGFAIVAWSPTAVGFSFDRSYAVLVVAGLLVGYGTQRGGGCTSGHGICGNARGSGRSIAATLTFMAVAIAVVGLSGALSGGAQ